VLHTVLLLLLPPSLVDLREVLKVKEEEEEEEEENKSSFAIAIILPLLSLITFTVLLFY
jgi:hypothetical protein